MKIRVCWSVFIAILCMFLVALGGLHAFAADTQTTQTIVSTPAVTPAPAIVPVAVPVPAPYPVLVKHANRHRTVLVEKLPIVHTPAATIAPATVKTALRKPRRVHVTAPGVSVDVAVPVPQRQ